MSTESEQNGTPRVETEVREKPARPPFTAEYRREIAREYTAAKKRGEKSLILRRDGLYASTVNNWCKEATSAMEPKKRGRKPSPDTPLKKEIERLLRENERLKRKLDNAELIIDVQKKSLVCSRTFGRAPSSPNGRCRRTRATSEYQCRLSRDASVAIELVSTSDKR